MLLMKYVAGNVPNEDTRGMLQRRGGTNSVLDDVFLGVYPGHKGVVAAIEVLW